MTERIVFKNTQSIDLKDAPRTRAQVDEVEILLKEFREFVGEKKQSTFYRDLYLKEVEKNKFLKECYEILDTKLTESTNNLKVAHNLTNGFIEKLDKIIEETPSMLINVKTLRKLMILGGEK